MALFDVVKYDMDNSTLCAKFPGEDFNTLSQLVVHETQEAVLFKDGKALDLFGAGRYTLETKNIPLLSKLVNLPFGGQSPFHCEVYFINKVHLMAIRWGTRQPVVVKDVETGMPLPIGANGQFAIQVEDSRKFLVKLVGTISEFSQDNLTTYFRGIMMSHIRDYMAKILVQKQISFIEINAHLLEISDGIKESLNEHFAEYGLKLINFNVEAVFVPEDDPAYVKYREVRAKKYEYDTLGTNYQQERTFDTLQMAAQNEGGNSMMGAGIGLGMGVNMGNIFGGFMSGMNQQVNTTPAAVASPAVSSKVCPACNTQIPEQAKFCLNCGKEYVAPNSQMMVCPQCNQPTAQGNFCANCGASLSNKCSNCGTTLEAGARFCSICGQRRG